MKPVVCRHAFMQLDIYIYKKKLIYIFTYLYYIIGLSQILSTLQIIANLVYHKPTKRNCDKPTLLYIYIYI